MTGPYERRLSVLDDERHRQNEVCAPLVTVVVTCYNYGSYIIDCLRSVAAQNYPRFHCIVVDDCSSDESVSKIRTFLSSAEANNRFDLFCHDQNIGQMGAFKTGLAHADGVFVVFVDADDLLLEDFISAHVRAHLNMEPVAFTSSDQYQINERGELVSGHHADLQTKGKFRLIGPASLHRPFWVWATTSSMMFRKAVLDLVMPYEVEQFRICADNYVSHFANLIGGSLLIPDVYGCYRRHGMNYFSSNSLVGGRHPTGDMRHHPRHDVIRRTILAILIQRHKDFCAVLSEGGYKTLLARAGSALEAYRVARQCPLFAADLRSFFFVKIFLCSWAIRCRTLIGHGANLLRYFRK